MGVLTSRIGLLVNPASRRGHDAEARVLQAFHAAGVEPVVEHTRCAGDGVRVARELAPSIDTLFVLGGDGTVMEASTGLADVGSSAVIGILPGGTGNQLARDLSIPMSPPRAVRALLRGKEIRIDLAILDGHRRVGIGAGFGLDAAMIAGADERLKRYFGPVSYVLSATAASLHPRRFAVRAQVDGRVLEREVSLALVLNLGRAFHGLFEASPGASLIDGQLDLVLVDAHGLRDMIRFGFVESLFRLRGNQKGRTFARGREISIETADRSTLAQVDGDLIDSHRLPLTVAPLAARMLAPAGARLI